MKVKTIQSILRRKFDSWLKSIPDDGNKVLKGLIRENSIISGGSIVSMLLSEEVSDYDIYFKDSSTAFFVAKYYVNLFKKIVPKCKFRDGRDVGSIGIITEKDRIRIVIKSAGVASSNKTDGYEYFETLDPGSPEQEEFIEQAVAIAGRKTKKYEYKPIFLTSNAITLSDSIQLIIRFFGEPDEIHKNFDFVHCTNYWKSWDNELILRPEAITAILTKELRYVGSLYPLCSLFRMRKFIQKGWTINAGQILKIVMQVNKLDLMDVKILEEQLIGVDIAYMQDLINKIKKSGKDRVDEIYICRLIDEIF